MQASTLRARVSGAFCLALHVKGDALAARHSRGERQISRDNVPTSQLHLCMMLSCRRGPFHLYKLAGVSPKDVFEVET
jgi:hypothetical protein